jgi:hypothetical protein
MRHYDRHRLIREVERICDQAHDGFARGFDKTGEFHAWGIVREGHPVSFFFLDYSRTKGWYVHELEHERVEFLLALVWCPGNVYVHCEPEPEPAIGLIDDLTDDPPTRQMLPSRVAVA